MTFALLQPTFFDGMELPLMSSQAAFHAKTLASLENSAAWGKERGLASGLKSSVWFANYDPITSSWRTSQHCLLAQVNGEADGLAEFSETWPSAGMMQSGKTYRRQPWALPIAENASGLWPTPVKDSNPGANAFKLPGAVNASMGFPIKPYQKNLATHLKWQKLMPTPTASMHKGSSPAALTRKDGADRSRDRLDHFIQSLEGNGKLNPTWVEWLMGFPSGHTDLQL